MIDSAATAIEFVNVTYRTSGNRTLISDLNLAIHRGETLMLLGRSGSGKTTTLKLINQLLDQSQGQVLVDGRSTAEWDVIRLAATSVTPSRKRASFPTTTSAKTWPVPKLEGGNRATAARCVRCCNW